MTRNVYLSLIIMCLTVYAIRSLPLLLLRKNITNRWLRSFLYYVPFVTLASRARYFWFSWYLLEMFFEKTRKYM